MKDISLIKENDVVENNSIKVKVYNTNNIDFDPSKKLLQIWEQECRLVARFCSEINCHTCSDLVGTLVKKEGDTSLYILPLCKSHSKVNHEISVPNFMRLTRHEARL